MKVKKYVGDTIQDTIFKVKADLGSEAIILNTRKVKQGGFLGFFASQKVEVMAALEEENNQETLNEINNLKKMIGNLQENWNNQGSFKNNLPEELRPVYKTLQQQGVNEELNRSLLQQLGGQDVDSKEEILSVLKQQLKAILGDSSPITVGDKQKVVLFAGPTGVGKTTTIAKLAAEFSLKQEKKVGLLTADTYRIAAVQQLKTYSDIVNLPLKILYDNGELSEIINDEYSDYDLILIDTAGSSWNDKMQLGRLKKLAREELIDEVHLLLSLGTKSEDLKSIVEQFSCLNPDKLLLTKLDETVTYGDIVNLRYDFELPYSYITAGQDVPEDIDQASAGKLTELLLGDIDA